ncbi:MAG TPA: hypothetical protein VL200_00475 [Lacunisphaera sp.]|jgi:hypothetical protein|nr:hypothetical protein [Lacunisphaera sp.]
MSRPRRFLLLLLPAAAAATTTEVSSDRPIINFSTTSWTADNHRAWLVRASEARNAPDTIAVKELTLSIFPGKADNEKVETLILSPTATVHLAEDAVTGPDAIRVINDEFEATGVDWRYDHRAKRISIGKHVRVAFNAEMKDILK